jgi:hypothetical protein
MIELRARSARADGLALKHRRALTVALVVVAVGVVAFFFLAPVTTEHWTRDTVHGPFILYTAQASLSFHLLGFGMLYNYTLTTPGPPYHLASYLWASKCHGFPNCQ